MVFIETSVFSAELRDILSDDEYRLLQTFLASHPDAGDVIQDTGGLRKIRWRAKGKGKRGGARIIYYYVVAADQIRMLLIYAKGVSDDLSAAQKRTLRQLNDNWG